MKKQIIWAVLCISSISMLISSVKTQNLLSQYRNKTIEESKLIVLDLQKASAQNDGSSNMLDYNQEQYNRLVNEHRLLQSQDSQGKDDISDDVGYLQSQRSNSKYGGCKEDIARGLQILGKAKCILGEHTCKPNIQFDQAFPNDLLGCFNKVENDKRCNGGQGHFSFEKFAGACSCCTEPVTSENIVSSDQNLYSSSWILNNDGKQEFSTGQLAGLQVANKQNNQYYATLQFGEKLQNFKLLVDTGSYLTWITGQACQNEQCVNKNKFYEDVSSTFYNYTEGSEQTIKYGSGGQIKGHVVSDFVQTEQRIPSTPRAEINFILAWDIANLTALESDGLMGLSPRVQSVDPNQKLEKGGKQYRMDKKGELIKDNIIMRFYESGSINLPVFSLYLGNQNEKSSMIIGGYDESRIMYKGTKRGEGEENDLTKTEDGIFWMDITNTNYWMVDLYEATIGNSNIDIGKDSNGNTVANIMINSGVSVNYVPQKVYNFIFRTIMQDKQCSWDPNAGLYYCEPCSGYNDNTFPTFKIRMGRQFTQHWFEIKPEDYLIRMQAWCIVQFRKTPDRREGLRQRWVLGDTFLRSYDAIHDLQNKRLGLVGNALTVTEDEVKLLHPEYDNSPLIMEKGGSPIVGIVVGVLSVLGVGAALFGAKVWYDKRKLGNTSGKSGREKAYAMKEDEEDQYSGKQGSDVLGSVGGEDSVKDPISNHQASSGNTNIDRPSQEEVYNQPEADAVELANMKVQNPFNGQNKNPQIRSESSMGDIDGDMPEEDDKTGAVMPGSNATKSGLALDKQFFSNQTDKPMIK